MAFLGRRHIHEARRSYMAHFVSVTSQLCEACELTFALEMASWVSLSLIDFTPILTFYDLLVFCITTRDTQTGRRPTNEGLQQHIK